MRSAPIIAASMVILLAAATVFLLLEDSGRESDADVEGEYLTKDRDTVDDVGQEQEPEAPGVRETRSVHSPAVRRLSSTSESEVEFFESSASSKDFFSEVSRSFQWSEEVIVDNVKLWRGPCENAKEFESYMDVPPDKLRELDLGAAGLVEFWAYCQEMIDPETGDVSDDFMSDLYDTASAEGRPLDQHWTGINDVISARDFDLAKDIVISQLSQALRNFDEAGVRGAILQLLRPGAEIITSPTAIDGGQPHLIFIPVVDAVSAALLCQQAGGCNGVSHPMVQRACVLARERTIGCLDPIDLLDAYYQTQTPVEHMLFWSLYDQVSGMLSSYRG